MDKHEKVTKTCFSQIPKDVETIFFYFCLIRVMPQGEEHTKEYPEMSRKMYPLGQEGL